MSNSQLPPLFATIRSGFLNYIKSRPLSFAINLVLCGLLAFCLDIYVAVVLADGIAKIQRYAFVWPAGGSWSLFGFPYQSLFFWILGGLIFSAGVSYWQTAGTKAVIDGIFDTPSRLRGIVRELNPMFSAFFVWGLALGFLLFGTVSAWFKILLVVFFLFILLAYLDQPALRQRWPVSRFLALGLATACLVAYPFGGLSLGFKIAGLFALLFLLLSSGARRRPASFSSVIILAVLICFLAAPELAFAHDGGLSECGGSIDCVRNSGSFASIMNSGRSAAGLATLGGVLGAPIGSSLGSGTAV